MTILSPPTKFDHITNEETLRKIYRDSLFAICDGNAMKDDYYHSMTRLITLWPEKYLPLSMQDDEPSLESRIKQIADEAITRIKELTKE